MDDTDPTFQAPADEAVEPVAGDDLDSPSGDTGDTGDTGSGDAQGTSGEPADDLEDDEDEVEVDVDVEVETGETVDDGDGNDDVGDDDDARAGMSLLEREGDVAADYLEGLLDIADLDGDIDMDVEGERALVSIEGGDLTSLVGRDGVVLEALQELTRLAVLRETGNRSRLMLDVDGHRARRRTELTERGRAAAEEVRRTGTAVRLTPMSAFERKVVHDAVAAAGLTSESEGEDPNRFVVVLPA
jgi:spoIIIJ-associated protein